MPNLWDRLPKESAKCFKQFCFYRDAGYKRTLKKTAEHFRLTERAIQNNSLKYNWVARVKAYEDYLDGEAQKQQEHEIKEMKKRHIQQALFMQKNIIERIQNINPAELSPIECVKMFDVAVKVERLSRDCDYNNSKVEVNTIIKNEDSIQSKLDKLSEEELRQYDKLLSKING